MACRVSLAPSSVNPQKATSAPICAAWMAIASPIPLVPPVTITRFWAKFSLIVELPLLTDQLPLCYGPVMSTPDGIAPGMAYCGSAPYRFLIDGNAQARPTRHRDIAVLIGKNCGVGQVVEEVCLLIIVNAQALFLDQHIVGTGIKLETGGERDGTKGAVWGYRYVVRLGHSCDLAAFGDASGVREVWLQNVNRAIVQHLLK